MKAWLENSKSVSGVPIITIYVEEDFSRYPKIEATKFDMIEGHFLKHSELEQAIRRAVELAREWTHLPMKPEMEHMTWKADEIVSKVLGECK